MKNILNILFAFILLSSCQPKPLDVKLDDYEQEIVISSQIIPNYLMMVGLTKSFTVLSSAGYDGGGNSEVFDELLIDSALVTIESAFGIDTLFKISSGLYASLNKLDNPGGSYHLTVKDYDLGETVTAMSYMQENVPLDTVMPSLNIAEGDTTVDMYLSFTDPSNQTNFYVLSVYSRNSNNGGLDVNTFFVNGSNNIEYQEIIEDKNKNGEIFERSFNLKSVSIQDSLVVLLSNISEGYYNFLEARERSGNLLSDITNEPVNYPSNVNNGLGYFNTHYPSIRFFDLNTLIE